MKYKNITISGLPGSGSTTLLKLLKDELQAEGWKAFNGGDFMRNYAVEKGLFDANGNKLHHDATVYGEDFDRQVDYGMRERLQKEEKWMLESWLSGFLAQGIPNILKVLVYCSDDAVRIDRIVNRDDISIEDAKKHIHERTEKNLTRWRRMYKKEWNDWVVQAGKATPDQEIDFYLPSLYDLVIDTYSNSREETLQEVLQALRTT